MSKKRKIDNLYKFQKFNKFMEFGMPEYLLFYLTLLCSCLAVDLNLEIFGSCSFFLFLFFTMWAFCNLFSTALVNYKIKKYTTFKEVERKEN